MIGRGERLILTGYTDYLHLRLEPFVADGVRPEKYIEQRITWEALAGSVIDLVPRVIGTMSERLSRPPSDPT